MLRIERPILDILRLYRTFRCPEGAGLLRALRLAFENGRLRKPFSSGLRSRPGLFSRRQVCSLSRPPRRPTALRRPPDLGLEAGAPRRPQRSNPGNRRGTSGRACGRWLFIGCLSGSQSQSRPGRPLFPARGRSGRREGRVRKGLWDLGSPRGRKLRGGTNRRCPQIRRLARARGGPRPSKTRRGHRRCGAWDAARTLGLARTLR